LRLEHELPILITQRDEIAVVVEIDELLARAALLLAGEIWELIITIEVDLEGSSADVVAL
jgi:hypothetical protein